MLGKDNRELLEFIGRIDAEKKSMVLQQSSSTGGKKRQGIIIAFCAVA